MKKIPQIALFLTLSLLACSEYENKIENDLSIDYELSTNDTSNFLEAVAIIRTGVLQKKSNKSKQEKYAFTINIVDFSKNIDLHDAYVIDNIEYSDNGLYNDETPNDGIYTSVLTYKIINQESNKINVFNSQIINRSEDFKYIKELNDYLKKKNIASKTSIKFGCKLRSVNCPETSWWNECWLGSPCTCIEFYDCSASIEVVL
tara:strand:+ start:353 stop:961 length:609 start_codon:yes stop_codon:yes gene_type:complete